MGQGKLADAARGFLQVMRRGAAAGLLSDALAHLPSEAAAWLRAEILEAKEDSLPVISRDEMPEPLSSAFASLKATKAPRLPDWLPVAALPSIRLQDRRLDLADVERLLGVLKSASLAEPPPLVSALKTAADRHSLDAFAWRLFEQWESMGASSKEKWAMAALGHIGGDDCVLRLTPRIRAWPGESQNPRAVFGLDCLRAIGTDTALMALNGIAQKVKFKALKERAQVMMAGIATARGLTREQLADRIVPDVGLDARGGRDFDFGPRQFRLVLGPGMKPLVRDGAGKVRPDLPAPNQADDPTKAEAATAEWKLLKKTLRETLKIQAERLEDAMITGRRWTPEEFETLLVRHPLMINLGRLLVFAEYDAAGRVARTFRVTEDQTLADQNDDPAPAPAGPVGIVHAAHVDDAAKSAWGQVLGDYEIIPPFAQLGREICRPEPEDLDATEITRFCGPKVPGIVMYGMLERSHWLRDTPADGGGFQQHSKHFPSANLTAFIAYDGLSIGYYDEPQELQSVYFVPGHVKPDWWGEHKNRLRVREVDEVVLSEVLRLAHAIVARPNKERASRLRPCPRRLYLPRTLVRPHGLSPARKA